MTIKKPRELLAPAAAETIFLGHCAISPLYRGAAEAIHQFSSDMSEGGIRSLPDYFHLMPMFHDNVAKLLNTTGDNISYIHNCAEGLCQIANGYPFKPGDEIISYLHEYPSNHYPWLLQKQRGVELLLLSDIDPIGNLGDCDKPRAWSITEFESLVSERTRVVAISHVQFSSGYGADLEELGRFCREHDIDLIVDCAQSLGCLPVYPQEWNISAVVASGWKWLMGPKGSAVLYTSRELREKLRITMAGPGLMKQGLNYLDHSWDPHRDGRMFEYSTLPWDHVAALNRVVEDIFLNNSMKKIGAELIRLQDILVKHLDPALLTPLVFKEKHRSGILTALVKTDIQGIVRELMLKGVVTTAPVGYLRLAPHFYQEDEEMIQAAELINEVCSGQM